MKKTDDSDWDEFHDDEIVDWKRVRSAIEHENELTNHRLTWMLNSQAFLFAAFALTFQASTKKDVDASFLPFYMYVLAGISLTGILAAAYLSSGLAAAQRQHKQLEKWWAARKKDKSRHPPISGDAPQFFLRLPYHGFPFIFVLGWLVFIMVTLKDVLALYADRIGIVLLVIVTTIGLVTIGFLLGRRGTKNAEQSVGHGVADDAT
jgi:hypothetical protein